MELKDTVKGMLSEDHKERFIAEYQQAVIRAQKLNIIISKYKSGSLDFELNCPIDLLTAQYDYLTAYIGAMVRRMPYENIENLPLQEED